MSVCLSPFHVVYFEAYFAPTSRRWMSKVFKDSESLGKSNGKKWSNISTFLFGSGLKSPCKKKFFLLILPWSTLLWHRCYYPHRSRDALSPVCGIFFDKEVELLDGGSVINGAYPVQFLLVLGSPSLQIKYKLQITIRLNLPTKASLV